MSEAQDKSEDTSTTLKRNLNDDDKEHEEEEEKPNKKQKVEKEKVPASFKLYGTTIWTGYDHWQAANKDNMEQLLGISFKPYNEHVKVLMGPTEMGEMMRYSEKNPSIKEQEYKGVMVTPAMLSILFGFNSTAYEMIMMDDGMVVVGTCKMVGHFLMQPKKFATMATTDEEVLQYVWDVMDAVMRAGSGLQAASCADHALSVVRGAVDQKPYLPAAQKFFTAGAEVKEEGVKEMGVRKGGKVAIISLAHAALFCYLYGKSIGELLGYAVCMKLSPAVTMLAKLSTFIPMSVPKGRKYLHADGREALTVKDLADLTAQDNILQMNVTMGNDPARFLLTGCTRKYVTTRDPKGKFIDKSTAKSTNPELKEFKSFKAKNLLECINKFGVKVGEEESKEESKDSCDFSMKAVDQMFRN